MDKKINDELDWTTTIEIEKKESLFDNDLDMNIQQKNENSLKNTNNSSIDMRNNPFNQPLMNTVEFQLNNDDEKEIEEINDIDE